MKELEKKAEDLSLKENIWSIIDTQGEYKTQEPPNIYNLTLAGSDICTFSWSTKDVRKIRSKGNTLPVSKPKLVDAY